MVYEDKDIALKGLAGLNHESNPDFLEWRELNRDKLAGRSSSAIIQTYNNVLFVQKYGIDKYNELGTDHNRNLYFESDILNHYIEDNFSNDSNYNTILGLTPEGKRHLLDSGYLSPTEIGNELNESAKKQRAFNIPGVTFPLSGLEGTVISGALNLKRITARQDRLIDTELELDKNRKISNTSSTEHNRFLQLLDIPDAKIIEEFDKIGSGYDVTITDDNAGTTLYHMPGSNYYNTFKDTKWLNNLSVNQKRRYLSQYYAIAENYGVADALHYLDSELQNYIADRQGLGAYKHSNESNFLEREWNFALPTLRVVSGIIKDVPAGFMQTALTLYGMAKYKDDAEALSMYLQGIDPSDGKRIQDGFNIDYWSKAQEYDTWNSNLIAEAERNGGISEKRTVWNKDQENSWVSAKTTADVGEQAVWIVTSLLASGGTSLVGKGASKVLGKSVGALTKLAKTEATIDKINKSASILQGLGRYTKLAVDATPIAITEAHGAFTKTLESNLGRVQSLVEDSATNRVTQALNEKIHQDNIKRRADAAYYKFLQDNPGISSEEVDYNVFLERATEEYAYILKNNYILEEEENFSEDREKAATFAVDAFTTTLVMSTIKTAVTNIGFKHFLYGAPFRKNFNINSPNIATRINKDGLLEVIEPSKYAKYVSPLVRNTFGEAFDEFMDTEIAALGIGYGTGKFDYYLSNKDSDIEGFNSIIAGIGNALVKGAENLTSEQSYREAFLGLVAGGANIMPTFRLSKPKEGTTFLEKIDHYLMNPVLHDILETKQETAAMKEKVEEINRVLKHYSSIIESTGNIIQAASDLHRATMAGYDVGMKSSKQDLGATLMLSIENIEEDSSLSNHNLTSKLLETLERASKGDITDAEVNDFFNQEVNRDLKGKISFEEAKSRIQENAQKLLEIRKEIKKVKQELSFDSRFTELSTVAQNGVIRNILKSKDYRSRAESLKRNLRISGGEKTMIVVGSDKDYNTKENELKYIIENLERKKEQVKAASKKENKDTFGVTSKESKRGLLKEIDRSIAKVKKELELLQTSAVFSEDSVFNKITLSKSQILNLDSNNLAYILDPENSSHFSEKQRKIIEEVRDELEKTINESSDLTYFPTIDNPSYYANVIAELENGAELIDRHTQVFLNYANEGKAADAYISEEFNPLTEDQKIEAWMHHFNNNLYTSDGTLVDDDKVINFLTFADPKAVHKFLSNNKLFDRFPNVYEKSLAWKQFLDIIGFDKSYNDDIKQTSLIVAQLLKSDYTISNEKELAEAISKISRNFSPEINKILNNYLNTLDEINKQRDATVEREKLISNPQVNDEDLQNLEDDDSESNNEDKKTKEEENPESTDVDTTLESNEQANTSLDTLVSESSVEEVKSTTINDPKILTSIEDSVLPDDDDLLKSDSPEMQGNTHYRYNGEDAREGTLKERVGKEEKDTTNSVFEWLSINKIKLQEIIDNELSSIADIDPEVHFMMFTSPQYGDGFSLNNVVFQVVEYTDAIKRIHKEDRGGVINSNGKEYLIIGTSGYNNNNEVAADGYIKLLNRLKKSRKHHSGPYFISSDYTKIKKIEAGWVVNSIGEDAPKSRNIKELFDDLTRNPHKLSLKRSKWLIQERTKVVTVRVNDNDVIHSPIDAVGNSGAIFLMVPAANGHWVPISVKPKLLHELTEVGSLRNRISRTIAGLAAKTFEARLAAKRELSKLLVISKEGEGVFLSKDENKINITYMGGKGSISIDLNAVDATAQLEKAFFSEQAGFKLNLSDAILGQYLDDYIDAGVLTTDAALLGTANASYTVYGVDENGKPILEEKVEPQVSTNKIETSDYISPSGNVVYQGKEYHEKGGAFYDSSDSIINDLDLITKLKTAKYLAKHQEKKPVRSDSKVDVYILSDNKTDPKVVRVIKGTGKIEILTKAAAVYEIVRQEKIKAKEDKEKKATFKLEQLEDSEGTTDEVNIEQTKSVEDLVEELTSQKSNNEESEIKQDTSDTYEPEIVETKDNSVLSDGIAVGSESESMKTSEFLGSPEFLTDEYFEILDNKGLADLSGTDLENRLRELGIDEFINPNNQEEVDNLFRNLQNCK